VIPAQQAGRQRFQNHFALCDLAPCVKKSYNQRRKKKKDIQRKGAKTPRRKVLGKAFFLCGKFYGPQKTQNYADEK
jgi:hypothetical protein